MPTQGWHGEAPVQGKRNETYKQKKSIRERKPGKLAKGI